MSIPALTSFPLAKSVRCRHNFIRTLHSGNQDRVRLHAFVLKTLKNAKLKITDTKSKEKKKSAVVSAQLLVPNTQHLTPSPQAAETCFLKAIEIALQQQAKLWELRATTSLARLWQQQGKAHEAHKLLSAVYNWFTEGFDTKDLQEATGLLEELHP